MKQKSLRLALLFMTLGSIVHAETLYLQSGEIFGGRRGPLIRLVSVVIDPDFGIQTRYYRDNFLGGTILHRELLSFQIETAIPTLLLNGKIDVGEQLEGVISAEAFEAEGVIPLFRISEGWLGDTEQLIAENTPKWTLHPKLGWLYTEHYPWVFPVDYLREWVYIQYHGVINLPLSPNNLFVERAPDALYSPEDPETFFHYHRTDDFEAFWADTAYYGWNEERGWIWIRESFFPWAYSCAQAEWYLAD